MRRLKHLLVAAIAGSQFIACSRDAPSFEATEHAIHELLILEMATHERQPVRLLSTTYDGVEDKGELLEKLPQLLEFHKVPAAHATLVKNLFEAPSRSKLIPLKAEESGVRSIVLAQPINPDVPLHASTCLTESGLPIGIKVAAMETIPPGAIYGPFHTLSRVAISPDGRFAAVKTGYFCAVLSGANETIIILARSGQHWREAHRIQWWIS